MVVNEKTAVYRFKDTDSAVQIKALWEQRKMKRKMVEKGD